MQARARQYEREIHEATFMAELIIKNPELVPLPDHHHLHEPQAQNLAKPPELQSSQRTIGALRCKLTRGLEVASDHRYSRPI